MSGIYIHVPFCRSKCAYCDFYSMRMQDYGEAYTDALINELAARRGELSDKVTTIYFGGGTPSALPLRLIDRIVEALRPEGVEEMTMEVNPEDVTDEFCTWLAQSPFNRVSMGVQSLNDDELKIVGRRHSAQEALMAIERLRGCGVDNLSLDLIYGLPSQSVESWKKSLHGILDLRPEHLSAYLLSYEPGTRLSAMLSVGKVSEASEEMAGEMYKVLCHETGACGYEHYEISNFALPGRKAVHNSSYWTMTPYLGLGPAAHSFTGNVRRYNPSDLKKYVENRGIVTVTDDESASSMENDRIITALRTAAGLDTTAFSSEREGRLLSAARNWIDNGVLRLEDGRLKMNPDDWLICDRVLVDLIEVDD